LKSHSLFNIAENSSTKYSPGTYEAQNQSTNVCLKYPANTKCSSESYPQLEESGDKEGINITHHNIHQLKVNTLQIDNPTINFEDLKSTSSKSNELLSMESISKPVSSYMLNTANSLPLPPQPFNLNSNSILLPNNNVSSNIFYLSNDLHSFSTHQPLIPTPIIPSTINIREISEVTSNNSEIAPAIHSKDNENVLIKSTCDTVENYAESKNDNCYFPTVIKEQKIEKFEKSASKLTPSTDSMIINLPTISNSQINEQKDSNTVTKYISDDENENVLLDSLPVFCCKHCTLTYLDIQTFNVHNCKNLEDIEQPTKYGERDGKSKILLSSVQKLEKHRKFTCHICSAELRSLSRILHHLRKCTPGPYNCPCCALVFSTRNSLNNHLDGQHMKEKCHVCTDCSKSFKYRSSLQKHLIQHHEDKSAVGPFNCNLCPKTFIRRIYLTNHKLRVHKLNKKHVCNACGNKFLNVTTLNVHCKVVHGEHRNKFTCTLCTKTFSRKEKLVHHQMLHTGL